MEQIRIGKADQKTVILFSAIALAALLGCSIRIFRALPESNWKWMHFILLYLLAGLFYLNAGVWIHEQLHCLAFRGTPNEDNTSITYERKFGLLLTGYYSVEGEIEYVVLRRALLMPLWLAASFILLGVIGAFLLPAWWLPTLLALAIISIFDMIHDIFMVSQMRKIGQRGIYKDCGQYLDVIIKA